MKQLVILLGLSLALVMSSCSKEKPLSISYISFEMNGKKYDYKNIHVVHKENESYLMNPNSFEVLDVDDNIESFLNLHFGYKEAELTSGISSIDTSVYLEIIKQNGISQESNIVTYKPNDDDRSVPLKFTVKSYDKDSGILKGTFFGSVKETDENQSIDFIENGEFQFKL